MADFKNRETPGETARFFLALAKGVPAGIALAYVLALVMSAILMSADNPTAQMPILAYAALYAGAFAAALVSSLLERGAAVGAALAGGSIYSVLMWITSLFVRGDSQMNVTASLIGYGGCVILAALAGILARGRTKRSGMSKKSPAMLAREKIGRRR